MNRRTTRLFPKEALTLRPSVSRGAPPPFTSPRLHESISKGNEGLEKRNGIGGKGQSVACIVFSHLIKHNHIHFHTIIDTGALGTQLDSRMGCRRTVAHPGGGPDLGARALAWGGR